MKSDSKVYIEKIEDISSYSDITTGLFGILDKMNNYIVVPPKARVLVKLNLCLLKGPETGATVDPRVVKALVKWLLERYDIEKIYLAEADATHLGADMAFKILGWEEVFKEMSKVELFNLSKDERVSVRSSHWGNLLMSRTMMEVDYLVSVGKLKTHTQQRISCIMKNQFGAIADKYKIIYHPRLAEAICDATAARIPDLCIVDGLIGMEGNGPTNGIPRRTRLLLASNDAISIDHFCARIMGFRPMAVPHLKLGVKRGLGSISYGVFGSSLDGVNLRFKFLPKWKGIIKRGIGMIQRGGINEKT